MVKKSIRDPADYIVPLNINGLEGRMLRMPAKRAGAPELLFVYGHHSSIERWWGLLQALNNYGAVTMPDLPGFGGMDSFYTIHKKPTIDALADYLAALIKLRYKRKKVVLVGMSFGFVIATRMLQRYPELSKKIQLCISLVGFSHHDDFNFSKKRYYGYYIAARLFSVRPLAFLYRYTALQNVVLRSVYPRTHNAQAKFADAPDKETRDYRINFEISLWQSNDLRTQMFTTTQILKLDNCTKKIAVPLWHVAARADTFFDNNIVEQHLQVIYQKFHHATLKVDYHAPTVLTDEREAMVLIPPGLRRSLRAL